ncbi:branched-chain amino acid ABC transporter permease [Halobacteriales archaeon QS_1_68_17]|nr:MAG: branched-chain amino acid ABC transporter permease [Halobacteriales archaeon QS_1_68_17]
MAVSDVVISFMVLVAIYAILSYGLTLKYGHTGLLDFGHVGFFLVGAYTSVFFVLQPDDPSDFTAYVVGLGDVPIVGTWIVGIVVATVLAGLIGGLVALPTIRLREDYLAITVLGISVIFQRFVQAESWFANGPDALRGYSPPLKGLFPLALDTLAGPVLFGLIAFVVWMVAVAVLARESERESRLPLSGIYLVASAGLATLDRPDGPLSNHLQVAAAAGVVAGVVSAALLATLQAILLVGTVVSLFSWFVLAVLVSRRLGELSRRVLATGVGLGTGFLVALLPIPYFGQVSAKIAGTLVMLGALVAGFYVAVDRLSWFDEAKISIIGVGALWFVSLWYFVLPVVGPVTSGGPVAALKPLFQNLVWVLAFGGDVGIDYLVAVVGEVTIRVDYQRFLLAGFTLFMLGAYYLLEVTVRSPFGRVLRAVRNDEDVVKSLGKDPFVYKVQSMVIGSALGGFAGALWAMWTQGLVFVTFAPRVTFIALLIIFIGGASNNKGTILGAAVFWAFQQATTQLASFFPPALRVNVLAFRLVVMGLLFLVVLYYLPEGLLGREDYSTAVEPTATDGGDTEVDAK